MQSSGAVLGVRDQGQENPYDASYFNFLFKRKKLVLNNWLVDLLKYWLGFCRRSCFWSSKSRFHCKITATTDWLYQWWCRSRKRYNFFCFLFRICWSFRICSFFFRIWLCYLSWFGIRFVFSIRRFVFIFIHNLMGFFASLIYNRLNFRL